MRIQGPQHVGCTPVPRLVYGPVHGRPRRRPLQGQERLSYPIRRVSKPGAGRRTRVSFKTYVQANILLSATYASPKEELFERARSSQESLEAYYMDENLTIRHTIHPDFRKELQTVLSTYFENIQGVKGAGGQGAPRRLQNPRRSLDPPAPDFADGVPAPVDQAPAAPADATLVDPPVPAGEAPPSPPGAGAGHKGKKKK